MAVLFLCGILLKPETTDVADLLPAQVLVVGRQNGNIYVKTDNGVSGSGATLNAAMVQAERNAAGVLYLETADYVVLIHPDASLLQQLERQRRLRPGTKLCRSDSGQNAAELPAYLAAHDEGIRLVEWKAERMQGRQSLLPLIHARPEGESTDEKKDENTSA